MKRLCTICARGGSKGIAGKNLRPLGGKPLIVHSIEQARAAGVFEAIAISSDSQEILDVARDHGVSILVQRPRDLAGDSAAKIPAIRHCLLSAEEHAGARFDTVVDLDATAPLRDVSDIKGAIDLLESGGSDNVVSAMPARRSPYFNLVEVNGDGRVRLSKSPASPIARRQDAPECFDLNASVFCWRRDALVDGGDCAIGDNTALFVMPEERSIDIDTETDFRFAEFLMSRT